jgi:hypothetical protein
MKLARTKRIKGEGALALLVIVLLVLGGIAWWLYSTRQNHEKNARIFAGEIATRLAVNYDEKYFHVHQSPEAQRTFLQSARDRLLDRLRELGVPAQPIEVEGKLTFTSEFFDPRGTFRAQLKYPNTTAQMDIEISRGMTVWQIDSINLTGGLPPPTATPAVTAVASPTPTPTPTPEPDQRTKRKRKR